MPTNTSGGTTTSFNNTPQAVDDFYLASEDQVRYFDVMANDLGGNAKTLWSIDNTSADGSGDLLTKDVAGICEFSELGAKISLTSTGLIRYDSCALDSLAAGETAIDHFTYAIRLSNGTLSWATVTVTLTGTNDAPVAGDDTGSGNEDTLISGNVATNDSDVDNGAVLTYAVGGTIPPGFSLNSATGAWSLDATNDAYQYLDDGETADVVVSYTVTDEHGASDTATLTITVHGVNDAPVSGGDDSADGTEDQASIGGNVPAASDVESDPITYQLVAGSVEVDGNSAADGTVTFNADGSYSYDPSGDQDLDDGESRTITFSYVANDGDADSAPAGVTITVHGANDAPALTGAAAVLPAGTEDNSYTVTLAQLLQGWTDADVESLSVTGLTASNGTVVANLDGSYTITPSANYNGPVTLNYNVSDGTADVATSLGYTLSAVNDPAAISGAISGSITEDAVPNTVGGDLNSTDVDGVNDAWNAVASATASANGYGTYTIDAAGNWVYALNNANPTVNALNTGSLPLSDSFTVTTADGTSQVVNITINGHTDASDVLAPTDIKFNLDSSVGGLTGNSLAGSATLGSFAAVDGDSASWTFALSGANAGLFTLSPTSGGSVNLLTNAAAIVTGNYTFDVTATDGGGNSYLETFTVSVGSSGGDGAVSFTVSNNSDISFGLNGNDTINGGIGDDALVGGQLTDNLNGGLGNDQLFGGLQNDNFIFNTAIGPANVDKILDFDAVNGPQSDKIHLDDAIFSGIANVSGSLSAADFVANAGGDATAATQNILYDTTTGNLYYDADGNGVGAKILFAHLDVIGGTVDAADFIVI